MTETTASEENNENVKLAKYGTRIGAYLTDMIVLLIVILPLNYYNFTELKSFPLYFIVAIFGILYKPLLEHYFGATVGKYALDLKVTNLNYNKISLKQSFIRSFILIIVPILFIPIQYFAFNNPEIINLESFMDITTAISVKYPMQNILTKVSSGILIVDLIFMLTDKEKMVRSLHDRIGKTLVIKVNK